MTTRRRADRLLVERGVFASRAKAQEAIAAGLVLADGVPVNRASDQLAVDVRIEAKPAHAYVSRGGSKLAAALEYFGFDPKGAVCLDVGASTGGFTDVLVRGGARRVYAVDVGRGQLDPSLAQHPKIVSLEGTDIRHLSPGQLPEPPDFIAIDVSFISLRLVLPAALALARRPARPAHVPEKACPGLDPGSEPVFQKGHAQIEESRAHPDSTQSGCALVALIKPQFEAGRGAAKKGIVRDQATHDAVCATIQACVASLGWTVLGVIPSPIAGGDGNREFLLGARRD
jgi:23S rRNA (cytidine1920-2'-O)/16S rRNA (cytidine1409-2'-O)-methyltransferase